MAVFTITIPDDQVTRVASALCAAGGYATVSTNNARLAVMAMILQTVSNVEASAARQAALAAIKPATGPALS